MRVRAGSAAAAAALTLVLACTAACTSAGGATPRRSGSGSASESVPLRPAASASLSVGPAPTTGADGPSGGAAPELTTTSSASPRATVPTGYPPIAAADCDALDEYSVQLGVEQGMAQTQYSQPAVFADNYASSATFWNTEVTSVQHALDDVRGLGYPADHPVVADLQAWLAALQAQLAHFAAHAPDTFRADYVTAQTAYDQWTFDSKGLCTDG